MSWRAGGAISSAVVMVASLVVHTAPPALAFAPAPRPEIPSGTALLHKSADSGIDIVRMPPSRPSVAQPGGTPTALPQQPPAVTPPVAPPVTPPVAPPPNQPPQPQGRVVKVTTKIGAQPREPQKGWLGVQMDALELPLALSLGLPNANGVLILEATANSPAGQAGLRFGDIAVGLNGRPITHVNELRQRVSSMTPGTEAELEVWRVTVDGGDFLQTLRRLGESGNAHVMFRLGRLYATGSRVARDEVEAVNWYRKGAAAGNTSAMTALALALLDGRGTGKDPQEGLRLLRAAADKDNNEAMFRLGVALVEGFSDDAARNTRFVLSFLDLEQVRFLAILVAPQCGGRDSAPAGVRLQMTVAAARTFASAVFDDGMSDLSDISAAPNESAIQHEAAANARADPYSEEECVVLAGSAFEFSENRNANIVVDFHANAPERLSQLRAERDRVLLETRQVRRIPDRSRALVDLAGRANADSG
jgi:hypothetical protein